MFSIEVKGLGSVIIEQKGEVTVIHLRTFGGMNSGDKLTIMPPYFYENGENKALTEMVVNEVLGLKIIVDVNTATLRISSGAALAFPKARSPKQ